MKVHNILLLSAVTTLIMASDCDPKSEPFQNSEPVTYFLSDGATLSSKAVSDGAWMYVTNHIYPTTTISCQWSTFLDHNITKGEFAYDLIFWAASECKAEIEFILKEDGQEQVLATKTITIPYISDSTAVQSHIDISNNPLEGINPKSGKNGELIFRITHVEGEDKIDVLYDANSGTLGCTSIIVFEDR